MNPPRTPAPRTSWTTRLDSQVPRVRLPDGLIEGVVKTSRGPGPPVRTLGTPVSPDETRGGVVPTEVPRESPTSPETGTWVPRPTRGTRVRDDTRRLARGGGGEIPCVRRLPDLRTGSRGIGGSRLRKSGRGKTRNLPRYFDPPSDAAVVFTPPLSPSL